MGNFEAQITVTITDGQNVTTRTDSCFLGGNLNARYWDGEAQAFDADAKALRLAGILVVSACGAARNAVS